MQFAGIAQMDTTMDAIIAAEGQSLTPAEVASLGTCAARHVRSASH